jgi:hypothetical protein
VLRWFGHVERMGDEKIAKQVLNGSVEGVRGRGRLKDSWMVVVDKCLKNKNVRSTKSVHPCDFINYNHP